ncbi:hypothetical protein [Marinomonas colpomeniae]|uniref:Uncharacterized protein n=1 Tax=Marinomonas colpomeniae TaxID=2774408 RepID=A0ABR8P0P6_9GAMM|nr:hypothetical protein [Marinomonas colpomeniae]MBD5771003.1 hypothetical protein [Marinomonas colpomeniae]
MNFRSYIISSLILGVLFISQTATAVDGYKDLKFGMSAKQIVASNVCTLQKYESGQIGVEYYGCDDFMFGGEAVEAGAFFIDDKFLRFAIAPSVDVALSLANGLSEKYGSPSSSSTQKEFQAVDALPNREAFLAYDKNTVYLKLMSDENYTQSAILLYTSPSYDILLLKKQDKSISNDL